MSTRGVIGFIVGGKDFLAYNHSDSYPSGLGIDVLAWCRKNLVQTTAGITVDPEVLGVLHTLELVDEDAEPTQAQLAKLHSHGFLEPARVSTGKDFYAWLRSVQGDLDGQLRSGFWFTDWTRDNVADSDVEWGYFIDVDQAALVVGKPSPAEDGVVIPFSEIASLTDKAFVARCGD